ncbi:MAG: hypothetical protein JO168_22270 [Solirubrobacterales bacterium]|nr:hypothetical protein [Solirubrobacterales bacterium]
MSDVERGIAQRLIDEINEFNLKATGIAEFHEMLIVETDGDGELIAGIYGWSWGGTCWIEALWVRADMRRSGCREPAAGGGGERGTASWLCAACCRHAHVPSHRSKNDTVLRPSASSLTTQEDTRVCYFASGFQVDRMNSPPLS